MSPMHIEGESLLENSNQKIENQEFFVDLGFVGYNLTYSIISYKKFNRSLLTYVGLRTRKKNWDQINTNLESFNK